MFFLLILSLAGFVDSAYLTWEHFNKVLPPCTVNNFLPVLSDCGQVLRSSYSIVLGVPLALIGSVHYALLATAIIFNLIKKNRSYRFWIIIQSLAGTLASLYFMYLQLFIIKSICLYCTLSAFISFTVFAGVLVLLKNDVFRLRLILIAFVYRNFAKRIFFLIPPETIHNFLVGAGHFIAETPFVRILDIVYVYQDRSLKQKLLGIGFDNPVGLAAGFDYNADLTRTLCHIGFGFQSVGTITNMPYGGNKPPRLGRLVKSRSLMVNKGFKNLGINATVDKLTKNASEGFSIPVGISIGMSHSEKLTSVSDAVADIENAFRIFEKSRISNSYYELNISCPNLVHAKNISFYLSKNLDRLLTMVDGLRLKKPVFIKMPIEKTNSEVGKMLEIIIGHRSVNGVIFGNLLKDRNDPSLVQTEVRRFKVGNFSGKPCEKRSNELIAYTYKRYRNRLIIIGCGGIFSAEDAYRKIRLGASLVQLITGMIFQGPQLISQINTGIVDLLKKDGFNKIRQAIGKDILEYN